MNIRRLCVISENFYVTCNLFLSDAFEMKANVSSGKRIFKCKIRVELHRVPPQKKNSSDLHESHGPTWAGLRGSCSPSPAATLMNVRLPSQHWNFAPFIARMGV